MEEMMNTEAMAQAMSDHEKEAVYQRALQYLTSSLTNDELFEESLLNLRSLGDYKDCESLLKKYEKQYAERKEKTEALAKKRKTSRRLQGIAVGIGFAVVLGLILLLVYALKLDIVR